MTHDPSAKAPSARFWNFIAPRYSRTAIANEAAYQKKIAATQALLEADMELLEFGCGTGCTALIHAPRVAHIHAIDISERMLEFARDKAAAEHINNVSFELGSIETLNVEPARYDMVLGLSILHLLEDREAAIRKSYELLKPGGYFVTSTACLGDFSTLFKWIAPIGHFLRLLPLVKVFSGDALVASIEAAGFKVQERWQPARNEALFLIAQKPEV